jgi:hypothetical protein
MQHQKVDRVGSGEVYIAMSATLEKSGVCQASLHFKMPEEISGSDASS